MRKGFTLVEVSILFVVFLIVAFLVAPLSLDDSKQAKFTSRWRSVQSDFENIFYSINTTKDVNNFDLEKELFDIISDDVKTDVKPYKITFLNGTYPNATYRFRKFKITHSGTVISIKKIDKSLAGIKGLLLYDVNGVQGPNIWGKDVFGYNIYENRFEPFGKTNALNIQKQDCSKNGTGLSCSNYYLIGGSFD